MTSTTLKRSLATAAVLAAGVLAAAAPAGAQAQGFDGPYSVQQDAPQGIIAILIGLAPAPAETRGFTPPIGSNKGS